MGPAALAAGPNASRRGTIGTMTDQAARYDRIAEGYARWWAPVLAPSARALLDDLDAALDGTPPRRILDVGTGTGTLLRAALERWPDARLEAIDASTEMAAWARDAVRDLPGVEGRATVTTAFADALPFPDDTFDAAISSFVLQLVPNRHRALREIRRVLRPGGTLAYVTWVTDSSRWRPDEVLDDVLDELGIDGGQDGEDDDEDEPNSACAGDLPSAEAAGTGLRRAGFRRVTVRRSRLEHRFDPTSYAGFVAEFDEESLVSSLDPNLRKRFLDALIRRLGRLDPGDLVLRTPIAYAVGHKPG